MTLQKTGIPLTKEIFAKTTQSLRKNPNLFIPFLIFAAFESLSLIFIYLIPRMPLVRLFGPPIRTFWGERFLHYPANFLLMPKLGSLARMGLSVVIGSLLTGIAVLIISEVYHKKQIKMEVAAKSALRKYPMLLVIILAVTALFYLSVKFCTITLAKYFIAGHSRLLFLKPAIWMGPILICINFIAGIFLQSLFTYAIPALMLDKEKLLKAIWKSFVLFKKLFLPTLCLVGLPMLLYIPIIVLSYHNAFLIYKLFPEFILWVAFLSMVVSSLIIDPLVTVATTLLYLEHKGNK